LYAGSTGALLNNYHINTSTQADTDMDIGNVMNIRNWHIADDDTGGAKSAMTDATSGSISATTDNGA
jgi:hypothetical protein